MDTTRRGNYESGSDYVLEYGELRFTFNERDFTERVEQAAIKLGFVEAPLGDAEREDLVNLAVNGEVADAHSELGQHINECWGDLNGPSERSLVHWIRRLVFRGAWLDQRVMEGELEVVFDETDNSFGYAQPDRNFELIELSPEPSWRRGASRGGAVGGAAADAPHGAASPATACGAVDPAARPCRRRASGRGGRSRPWPRPPGRAPRRRRPRSGTAC